MGIVQIPGNRDREPGLAHDIQLRLFGLCFPHPAGFAGFVILLLYGTLRLKFLI